ncbi:MAG: polyphenol oxidase family protein [Actinobacteria bacterium]|nr:polyphenol oxidase family protein [Actinomycetota bacterium]
MRLFEWDAPSPYRVAFSTRLGGVSEGPYQSLNLGLLTEDAPENVVANRRLLCDAVGADAEHATMAFQVHGSRVAEARTAGVVTPGTDYERCDGLWTERSGRALMLLTADCFPVAVARRDGAPALAILHVGWRGLLDGVVENGVRAVRGDRTAAAIGPGIGPCCYSVGEEVAAPFRERYGDGVLGAAKLDLGLAVERALRDAGVTDVDRNDHCTSCEPGLFFSHRRDRGVTGRQGIVAYIR